jgi:hypothetical protein
VRARLWESAAHVPASVSTHTKMRQRPLWRADNPFRLGEQVAFWWFG